MRVIGKGQGGVAEHHPTIPRKLADGAYVSGRAEHNRFRFLPPSCINGIAGVGFNSRRKFEAVIPEHLWSSRLHHKSSKTPFELTNVALGSLLPRGVWLGLSQLAVSLVQLASKIAEELFFGVVNYHLQWNAIMTKKQGESLMRITLRLHQVNSHPSKICGKELGTFVPSAIFNV